MNTVKVSGHCDPGFEPLREAFEANFSERGEIGAAIALVVDGRLAVDLWGGSTDEGGTHPWQANTLVNIWSTTKGVTAACFAMLVDRGQIEYDKPVAHYWPEFGAAGKEQVTVAMMLSHQAGLCGFDTPASMADLYDLGSAAARLAAMEPLWEPGTQSGYHAVTVGFLASELFRRVEGRSIREFVADELSAFDLSIGLPADRTARAATMIAPPSLSSAPPMPELNQVQIAALANPVMDPTVPNTAEWRAAEIPSANGFAHARGLAQLYGALSIGNSLVASAETVAEATRVRIEGPDAVLGLSARWASGFLRNILGLYGSNETAFGHSGWGGSFAFADPDRKLGFAYAPNRMGSDLVGDPRSVALVAALEICLPNER